MKSHYSRILPALLLISIGHLAARDVDILTCLPRIPIPGGWVPDGQAQQFKGEDLYVYIDGGADIYQEYGFVAVAVQDYKSPAGKSVSLEIFEMSDEDAAFGMFTFKTTGKGEPVNLGDGGQLEDYYLNFRAGRYILTLTGFDSSSETIRGLREVGQAAAGVLTAEKSRPPALVGCLPPAEGFEPRSVKYVRGRLGLNNILPVLSGAQVIFRNAVRAAYQSGDLTIIDCGEEVPAVKVFKSLESVFQDTERFANYRTSAEIMEATNEKSGLVRASLFKNLILITSGLDARESDALMTLARTKLPAKASSGRGPLIRPAY
jgi:hypothetical protein